MKPLYEDESWDVSIRWTKPMLYESLVENGSDHDDHANLYLIIGRYSKSPAKIMYVGKTIKQWVSKRLSQKDHRDRYTKLKSDHPNHWFQVSHGIVTMHNGHKTAKRISDIEQLLIFANDSSHVHNVKSIYTHGVSGSYRIESNGYRCSLPKCLSLGLFVAY